MPEYINSCIYIIKSKDVNIKKVYIGSTCNFSKRKSNHKRNCNNKNLKHYNYNVYKYIRENNGWTAWKMTIVKNFPCNNKSELEAEEKKTILEFGFDNLLNKQQPTRTQKQYRIDNKERMKQYYEDKKEALTEYQKQYRIDNKEKLKEKKNQKFTCDCGGRYTLSHKSTHKKSKKHQKYIEQLP